MHELVLAEGSHLLLRQVGRRERPDRHLGLHGHLHHPGAGGERRERKEREIERERNKRLRALRYPRGFGFRVDTMHRIAQEPPRPWGRQERASVRVRFVRERAARSTSLHLHTKSLRRQCNNYRNKTQPRNESKRTGRFTVGCIQSSRKAHTMLDLCSHITEQRRIEMRKAAGGLRGFGMGSWKVLTW